jgi:hypothetical protein
MSSLERCCEARLCDRNIVPGSWFCLDHWACALPELAEVLHSAADRMLEVDFGYLKCRFATACLGESGLQITLLFDPKSRALQDLLEVLNAPIGGKSRKLTEGSPRG